MWAPAPVHDLPLCPAACTDLAIPELVRLDWQSVTATLGNHSDVRLVNVALCGVSLEGVNVSTGLQPFDWHALDDCGAQYLHGCLLQARNASCDSEHMLFLNSLMTQHMETLAAYAAFASSSPDGPHSGKMWTQLALKTLHVIKLVRLFVVNINK